MALKNLLRSTGNWNPSAAVKSKSHYPKLSLHKAARIEAQLKKQRHLAQQWLNGSLLLHLFRLIGGRPQTNPYGLSSLSGTLHLVMLRFPFLPLKQESNGFCEAPRRTANKLSYIDHQHKLRTTNSQLPFSPKPPRLWWRFAPHSLNHWTPRLLRVVFRQGCATTTTV